MTSTHRVRSTPLWQRNGDVLQRQRYLGWRQQLVRGANNGRTLRQTGPFWKGNFNASWDASSQASRARTGSPLMERIIPRGRPSSRSWCSWCRWLASQSMLGRCPLASSLLSLLRADSARGTAKADVPARPPGPTPDFLRERSVGIAGKGGGAVQIALGKERPGSPAPLPVVTGIDAREILLTCPRPLPYIFLPHVPTTPS